MIVNGETVKRNEDAFLKAISDAFSIPLNR